MFNVSVENTVGRVILRCEGRLVLGHETSLLCAAIQQGRREIVVDLREVTAMDTAGTGALISLQAAGFYLIPAHPTRTIQDLLVHTKLDSVFEIVESKPIGQITSSAATEAVVAC